MWQRDSQAGMGNLLLQLQQIAAAVSAGLGTARGVFRAMWQDLLSFALRGDVCSCSPAVLLANNLAHGENLIHQQ